MCTYIDSYTKIIMLVNSESKIKYCSLILCIAQTWCVKLFVNKCYLHVIHDIYIYIWWIYKKEEYAKDNVIYWVDTQGYEICKLKWKEYRDL